jgi:branched-chain amino acid aminotransferase
MAACPSKVQSNAILDLFRHRQDTYHSCHDKSKGDAIMSVMAQPSAAGTDPVGPVGHLPYAYFEGEIVPLAEARVSVATHALQYGTSAFGGIRGYLSADGQAVNLFRLRDHYRRFVQSAALLRIGLPFDVDGLCRLSVELTRRNGHLGEVYQRPFVYKAGLDLTPGLAGIADGFALFMLAIDGLPPLDRGLSVCVSSWQRVTDNAIPPRGKVGGSYVNASLIRDEAHEHGFDDAIVLNARGKAGEGSVSNLFLVRDGALITPPVCGDILEGINRRAVLELAVDLGVPVVEREIDRTELYVADELFLCGTRMQIAWITAVDRRPIGGGQRGPITARLAERFEAAVRGGAPEYAHWMTRVEL